MVCKQCCRNCPIQRRRRPFRITRFLNFAHCPIVLYSATCSVCNTSRRSKSTNQANLNAFGLYLPQNSAFPKQGMYYQMAQLRTNISMVTLEFSGTNISGPFAYAKKLPSRWQIGKQTYWKQTPTKISLLQKTSPTQNWSFKIFTSHSTDRQSCNIVSLTCQYFNKILGPITLKRFNNNFIILTAMFTLLSTTTI
jgi:hypothetical protein